MFLEGKLICQRKVFTGLTHTLSNSEFDEAYYWFVNYDFFLLFFPSYLCSQCVWSLRFLSCIFYIVFEDDYSTKVYQVHKHVESVKEKLVSTCHDHVGSVAFFMILECTQHVDGSCMVTFLSFLVTHFLLNIVRAVSKVCGCYSICFFHTVQLLPIKFTLQNLCCIRKSRMKHHQKSDLPYFSLWLSEVHLC